MEHFKSTLGLILTTVLPLLTALPLFIQVLGGLFGLVLLALSIRAMLLDIQIKKHTLKNQQENAGKS